MLAGLLLSATGLGLYPVIRSPWHAILRVYGGSLTVLDEFSQLYRKFLAADRGG